MKTVFKIAWRNIWRNRLRSLVVITSIVLGIWAGVFVNGFSYGLNKQRIQEAINSSLSHIQVHHPEWSKESKIRNWLNNPEEIHSYLRSSPEVQTFTSRVLINGMAASANGNGGVQITGIDPEAEDHLTGLAAKVTEGNYLGGKNNRILLGRALAQKLEVKEGSRMVLTFTDEEGVIISGAFKVAGIYESYSSQLEELKVYVQKKDLYTLLGTAPRIHEVALLLKDQEMVTSFRQQMQNRFPEKDIQSWDQLSPELGYANELMSTILYIIIGIIMLALSFGIVNTMLMAVLERRRELGMLMAVGMNRRKVFAMILSETLLLSLCGGPLGIILGYITIAATGNTGINLSFFEQGLESFGIGTIIYPEIETSFYFVTGLLVVCMALLSSVYPARRALKLNPVEAIRTI